MALVRAIKNKAGGWDDAIPELLDAQCGYCGKGVAMERVTPGVEWAREQGYSPGSYDVAVWAVYVCPREACLKPTAMFFTVAYSYDGSYLRGDPRQIPRGQAQPMDGLLTEIQADRLEAWSCFYGGDRRAAVIMGRAAIQRAARAKQAQGAGLKAEIADLARRGVITQHLKEWADEVRIAGDDAAHPTTLGKIDPDEAKESLEFMDAFLEHAVALPARRDARKQARKAQTATP